MPELTPVGPDVPDLEDGLDEDVDVAELEQKLRDKYKNGVPRAAQAASLLPTSELSEYRSRPVASSSAPVRDVKPCIACNGMGKVYDSQKLTDFRGCEGMTRVMESACQKCRGTGILVDGKAEQAEKGPDRRVQSRSIPAEFSDGEEMDEAEMDAKFG